MPEFYHQLEQVEAVLGTPAYAGEIARLWPQVGKQTIDYGVMEGAREAAVIPVDEFTGQYLEGRDQSYDKATGMWVAAERGDDLERTADQDAPETGSDTGAAGGVENAEAEAAIARYEAGDQGWSVPPADPSGDDDRPRA